MTAWDDRRIGRFRVSADRVRTMNSGLLNVMQQCIVIRAEHMLIDDQIEYTAVSETFRSLVPGELIPEYRWIVADDEEATAAEVK